MSTTEYKTLIKNQTAILKELSQLRKKVATLGSLRRFEEITQKGRKFAKASGIKQSDVIRGD